MNTRQGSIRLVTFAVTAITATTMWAQVNDSLCADTTLWYNQTQQLEGVVVKGRLPKTRVKGDAMRTTVTGTILEKAGTVNDAMAKIPSLETERDGGVRM